MHVLSWNVRSCSPWIAYGGCVLTLGMFTHKQLLLHRFPLYCAMTHFFPSFSWRFAFRLTEITHKPCFPSHSSFFTFNSLESTVTGAAFKFCDYCCLLTNNMITAPSPLMVITHQWLRANCYFSLTGRCIFAGKGFSFSPSYPLFQLSLAVGGVRWVKSYSSVCCMQAPATVHRHCQLLGFWTPPSFPQNLDKVISRAVVFWLV